MFDRSVVVVLADHGAAMRPGDFRRRFTARTVGELGPVPLFIKAPGQHRGRTMTKHVRTLDVVPTIAALVGARLPWHADGRSLAGGAYPEATRLRFHRVFGAVDVVASVAALERRRSSALAEQLRLFRTGSPFPGLGGPARRDDLVGKPAAEVRPRPGDAAPVVASPEQFEDVDPTGQVVPSYVTGGVAGLGAGVHRQVAVEVNGRVAAVGETFDLNGGQGFAVMLPDAVFRRGRNDVRAVVVG
jgi:hypothetical protein